MSRVVLAMSGGVDSSVAAWLLREAGHEVIGLFMRHGQEASEACSKPPGRRRGCCSAADAADARRVADQLGIPFYAVNFEQEFGRIIDYFVAEYGAGRTPNPCIVCNTWLKFGRLVEYADSVDAPYIATGHYARLMQTPQGQMALCRGRDPAKDQSYVLWGIRPELLPRLMLPVGEHYKHEIREMAGRLGLRVADKPDSQEICFVPDQDHARFVQARRQGIDTAGEIVTTDGKVVGRHGGLEHFTIGQRKGLRIAFGEPRYVVRIEAEARRVVVGTEEELDRWELTAHGANWLTNPHAVAADGGDGAEVAAGGSRGKETKPLSCQVKIRYRSEARAALVEVLPDGRFYLRFEEPCRGIAPGQAVVCYEGERLLGGGWIE